MTGRSNTMEALRVSLRILLSLMMLAIAAQFFFAAAGAFGATSYDTHKKIGAALVIAGLVALVVAAVTRSFVIPIAIGAALLVVQDVLGHYGFRHPWLGALHGLNALAIGAVFGSTTGRAWRAARRSPATPQLS
jgi:hypothetical protein